MIGSVKGGGGGRELKWAGGAGHGRHVICSGYFISPTEMLCDIIIPAEVNEAMR